MRKGYWLALALVLVLAVSVLAVACGGGGTTTTVNTGPLKFGVAISLTGDSAAPCGQIKEGFQTEVDYVNGNGGINGRQVEVTFVDDQSTMTGATTAIQSLIDQHMDVIFGPFPQFNQAATRPLCEQAKILQITFGPPTLSEINGTDTQYTYCFDPATGADGCADAFLKEMKADGRKNVLGIGDQMPISQETLKVLGKSLPASGITATIMTDSYGLGQVDPNPVANLIKAKADTVHPDAIILASNPVPVNGICKSLKALGVTAPVYVQASGAHPVTMFVPAGNDPVNVAGNYVIGPAIVDPSQVPDTYPAKADLVAFIARWKANYGAKEPFTSFFIGFAYDAFHQAEQAIKNAKTQDEAGWAASLEKVDWWGAQGHYVFSKTDHIGGHGGFYQWQYTNGQGFKLVRELNAETAMDQATKDAVAALK